MELVENPVAIADEWEQRHDESSRQVYYVNLRTGESSWEVPMGFSAGGGISLAHQWTEATDETGRVYYMNLATMETTWDPPPGFYSTAPESSVVRPSTAEQMDELNALLSGGDGDEDEGGELQAGNNAIAPETSPPIIDDSAPNESTTAFTVEDGSEWMMFLNETDGLPYYYNHITGECVWEPPASFLEYHAQLADGEFVGNVDEAENNQGSADTSNPTAMAPPPPHTPMPSTPIQITPAFEEEVRRAIETVSKTPVGSSRLLFVRTPTVKSLDSSRSASRPTSSSGASARQRVATARRKVEEEEDEFSKRADATANEEKNDSQDFPEQSAEDALQQPVMPPLEQLELPPSDDDIELLQREAMMLDLERDEMALTIQCLARCFLARARVAKKRAEKQQAARADARVVSEMAGLDEKLELGNQEEELSKAQPVESASAGMTGFQLAENLPVEDHGMPQDFSSLYVSQEQSTDESAEVPTTTQVDEAHVREGGSPVQPSDDFRDGADQPFELPAEGSNDQPPMNDSDTMASIPQSEKDDHPLDVRNEDSIDASMSASPYVDNSTTGPGIESVDVCDDPEAQENEGGAVPDTRDDTVDRMVEAVSKLLSSDAPTQRQVTEEEEAAAISPSDRVAEPSEGVTKPIAESHAAPVRLQPDVNESVALPLDVPLQAPSVDITAHEGATLDQSSRGARPESGTLSERPSARQARSSRRPEEKMTSRTARAQDLKPVEVDTSTGRLAILNISTFFPSNRRQSGQQPALSSKLVTGKSAALTEGITRKIIPVDTQSSDRSTATPKTTEQRDQARAVRAEAMRKSRDLVQAKWHEEVAQCRQVFAMSAQKFAQKAQEVSAAEVVRRNLTEEEAMKWLQEQSAKKPISETSKDTSLSLWDYTRGDSTYEGAKARMQAAMEPQTFVRSTMRERFAVINRVIERFQLSEGPSDWRTDSCAYWQQLAQCFPSSFEAGTKIDDPYWARLHAKLQATATSSHDIANEFTRHRTDTFDSLLHAAASRGHHDFVAFLASDLHADVNAIDSTLAKTTPLHEACRGGHGAVVDVLLSHGACLDAVDLHGETPLHVACRLGWTQLVHCLIDAGEAQDKRDRSNTETRPLDARVLRRLSWVECFHLHNDKLRRAMDIATLPSLVDFLQQYSHVLPSPQNETVTSSTHAVGREHRPVVKKKKTKPQRPKSAAKLNPISAR